MGENQQQGGAWPGAALIAVSPGIIMVSSIWGQWDALSALLLVLAVMSYGRSGQRPELSGALAAWACLIKPQLAVFFIGFLIAWLIRSRLDRRALSRTVRYALGGVIWAQLLMLPFDMGLPGVGARWQLHDKLREASDLYRATTLGASNVWMIVSGRSWVWDTTMFGPLTARSWGNVALVCLLAGLTAYALRLKGAASPIWLGTSFFFTFFMVQTRMHERYMFPVAVLTILLAVMTHGGVDRRVGWGMALLAQASFAMAIEASLAIGISGDVRAWFVVAAACLNVLLWITLIAYPAVASRKGRTRPAEERSRLRGWLHRREEHDMSDPTEGHVEQGDGPDRRPGTTDGTSTLVEEVWGRSSSRGGRPGATAVIDNDSTKVVAFEFAEGDELKEHAARHPVLIQVVRGRVSFELPDRTVELAPGALLHLTPMLRHAVRALEPTTLTVTMLLPHA